MLRKEFPNQIWTMNNKISIEVGAAEAAWIVPSNTKRNKFRQRPQPTVAAQKRGTVQQYSSSSQPPQWMKDLTYHPPPSFIDQKQKQHILLLVGIPGSGKTTLSETLCRVLPWKYKHVNQDILKTRNACLKLTQQILNDGFCPIIDRCNVSVSQREYFANFILDNDESKQIIPVDCIILKVASKQTCIDRCKEREFHPTLTPENVDRVHYLMEKEWQNPDSIPEPNLRSIKTVTNEPMLQEVVNEIITDAVFNHQP